MGTNKTGSILIWSIFLVIFVTFSFLYISSWISKQLDKNKLNIQEINNDTIIDNISSDNLQTQALSSNESYTFDYFNSFHGTLKRDETIDFKFSKANTGSIEIKNGGPVHYQLLNNTSTLLSEWILTGTLLDLSLTGSAINIKTLSLENLWGLAEITIEFDTASGISFPYNYYKRVKNIGGIEIVKEIWSVK